MQVARLGTGSSIGRLRLNVGKDSCLERDSIGTPLILFFCLVNIGAAAVLCKA